MRKTAFTLIELLVVIAIIAILAAILFPVFAAAKEAGKRTTCLANTKQIGTAMLLYLNDYDDAYPNTGSNILWFGRNFRWPLMPYLAIGQTPGAVSGGSQLSKSGQDPVILICPSDPSARAKFDGTSYAYSSAFYHSPSDVNVMTATDTVYAPITAPVPISQTATSVAQPAQKVLAAEFTTNHKHGPQGPLGIWGSATYTASAVIVNTADCRTGARSLLFADNHGKYIDASRMTVSTEGCPDFNLTPDGIQGVDLK